jgi:hypothetical protein
MDLTVLHLAVLNAGCPPAHQRSLLWIVDITVLG